MMDEPEDRSCPHSNTTDLKVETFAKRQSLLQQNSDQQECIIAELKARLQEYASANAILVEKLETCESENEKLRSQNEELMQQLRRESGETRMETLRKQEKEREVTGLPEVLRGDGIVRGNGFRNAASLDLETANRLLTALEDAPLHMSYCDTHLRYVWFNHTLKGFPPEEVAGKRDEDIVPTETEGLQELINLKQRALQSGQTQMGEITVDLPQNGRMTWMVTTRPHFNQEGAIIGVSTASIDITEQVEVRECLSKLRAEMSAHKATEDELRRVVQITEEAIHAKNVFLAIMSHEIRTPLNGLLGLAEALDSLELNDEQRELVSAILSSGVIIADILGDILDLASMEFGVLELEERPFDPSDIVQDILKMAHAATRGKDIVITSEIFDKLPRMVVGDAVRVRQIMKYLVLNAIKFTEKGSVRIRLGVKDLSVPLNQRENIDKLGDNRRMESQVKLEKSSPIGISSQKAMGSMVVLAGPQDSRSLTLTDEDIATTDEDGLQWQRSTEVQKDCTDQENITGCICAGVFQDGGVKGSGPAQVMLYCEVADTGVGIPKEAFPTLFDKFTQVSEGPTRSYGGTGLGLAICKRLVEFMGGELTVTSDLGKGSTFTFSVLCKTPESWNNELGSEKHQGSPIKRADVEEMVQHAVFPSSIRIEKLEDSSSPVSTPPKPLRPRILLAEDNKVNVMVAISMLKRLGFTAKVVANGVEALEAIRKEKYDLVLLDICMPLMDGLQVAYAIRKYEETGEWPQGDLRDIFQNPSSSLLQDRQERRSTLALDHAGSVVDAGEEKGVDGLGQERRSTLSQEKAGNLVKAKEKNEVDGLADVLEDWRIRNTGGAHRLPIVAVTANALRSDVDNYFAHGMDAFIAKPVMFQKLQEILQKYLPTQTTSNTAEDEAAGSSSTICSSYRHQDSAMHARDFLID